MQQYSELIVPVMMGITAIILLLAGGRLLKPAIGLSAALFGAGLGLLYAPSLLPAVHPFIIAGCCAGFFAVIAVVIAKFAIVFILGIGCATIAPLLIWQIGNFGTTQQIVAAFTEPAVSEVAKESKEQYPFPRSTEEIMTQAFSKYFNDSILVFNNEKNRINNTWDVIPSGFKMILIGSAITGLLIGLLVATFMQFTAAVIVTSFGGSLLLYKTLHFGVLTWSTQNLVTLNVYTTYAVITAIALIGLTLQLTVFKKQKVIKKKNKK